MWMLRVKGFGFRGFRILGLGDLGFWGMWGLGLRVFEALVRGLGA